MDEVPPLDLVKALEEAKIEGNQLFQQGRLSDAAAAYERGAVLLDEMLPSSLSEEVRKPALAIYCNAAHALLKGAASSLDGSPAEQACAMADKALALEPGNVKARFRRGCAWALREKYSLAAADFRHVLKLEPGNDAAREELERAQEQLRRSFEATMSSAEGLKADGAQLFEAGAYFDAYEVWKQGIDSLKEAATDIDGARKLFVAMCNNSAQALLKCTDVDGANTELARAMAQKALAMEPTNVKALFRRGCAYANMQEWQLARADFLRVLKAEPANEAARRELQKADEALAAMPPLPRDEQSRFAQLDTTREKGLEPSRVVQTAQREAERFRQEALDVAEARNCGPLWCQRFNKLQVQTTEWAQLQLADPEMLQDLSMVWGPLFEAMDDEEREDFVGSVEFLQEARLRYSAELEQLQATPLGQDADAGDTAALDE